MLSSSINVLLEKSTIEVLKESFDVLLCIGERDSSTGMLEASLLLRLTFTERRARIRVGVTDGSSPPLLFGEGVCTLSKSSILSFVTILVKMSCSNYQAPLFFF